MSVVEWKVKGKNILQRELKGAEYLINVTEENQGGNYQLIFSVTLDSNIPHHCLEKRFDLAYLALRKQYPLLGIRYSPNHLDQASIIPLETSQKAKEWLGIVTKIVRLSSTESVDHFAKNVAQKPLDTPDRMSKAYLVLGPGNRQAGFVLHTSHALTGHYTVRIMDTFVKLLVQKEFERDIQTDYQPEDLNDLVKRLPGSLEEAYKKQFKPTSEDISQELMRRQTIGTFEQNPKLGIPLHQSWPDRKSLMQNLLFQFNRIESKRILLGMKQIGISPTSCVFASILYAIQHFISSSTGQNSTMKGCMLNFSTHASRWVPCEGQTGDPIISMAIVPSAVWIPAEATDFEIEASKVVTRLAKRIAEEQDRFLQSPHSMAYASEMAKMLKNAPKDAIQESQVEKSNAVLTSQGPMPISCGHKNGQDEIRIIDYNHFGRNTDPTVCFSLYSVHGSLRIGTIFDERFFDVQKVEKTLRMVGNLVRNLQAREDQSNARL